MYQGRGSCRWNGFGGHVRPGCPVVPPEPAHTRSLSAVLRSGRWQGDCLAHRRWTWNLTSSSWLSNSALACPPAPESAPPLTYTNKHYGNFRHTCRKIWAIVVDIIVILCIVGDSPSSRIDQLVYITDLHLLVVGRHWKKVAVKKSVVEFYFFKHKI